MQTVFFFIGVFLVLLTLWEGFETIVLPRSVTRKLRITRQFYRLTWPLWKRFGQFIRPGSDRQRYYGIYGPLSLPLLLAFWAILLMLGFSCIISSMLSDFHTPDKHPGFGAAFYLSGVTFTTLGYGDITPRTEPARLLMVWEGGVGFGFLALVIGYLPVLYQAFSRREVAISRLDSRASSPATAGEILTRYAKAGSLHLLTQYLAEWELWAAEILESHLSYPVLTYYRSQHEHESWLGALLAIMDTCTALIVGLPMEQPWETDLKWQAEMTYAIGRHAIIDLAYTFNTFPSSPNPDRLPAESLGLLQQELENAGLVLNHSPEQNARLHELRAMYEPYFNTLAEFLAFPVAPWHVKEEKVDNWQTSAWDQSKPHF